MKALATGAVRLPQEFEIVADDVRLAEVAPAWAALWVRADGLIFQHPAWIEAWRRTDPKRDRRRLRIGLLWKGGALQAVLPLAVLWRGGIRVLEWAAREHSDYCDILLAPDCDRQALGALWRKIMSESGYDMAYLNRLLPDAAVTPLLGDSSTVKLGPSGRCELNYRVAGDWTSGGAWFEAQTKKTRQNHRRGRKAMEAGGKISFRRLAADEPLGPLLERVATLKRKWLARHGRESDLFDEGSPALAALVAVLAEQGLLHVFVLECAGEAIAVSINFVQHGRMMAFITTYDPDFERGSPGTVLMMDYIGWSLDRGLAEIDFLCGGEDFKRRFATRSLRLESAAGARTIAGRLALLGDAGFRAAKAWSAGSGRPAEPAKPA